MAPGIDNALRFRPSARSGHVESYFLRANDPKGPRAFWIKATILAPITGPPIAELWCIVWRGEGSPIWAARKSVPFTQELFAQTPDLIRLAGAEVRLGPEGGSIGRLLGDGDECSWDVHWSALPGRIGGPQLLFPHRALLQGPFPSAKLVTPYPALRVSGTIRCANECIEVADWIGMQGHNWGKAHAWEYAWGQCIFLDEKGVPECQVEAFTGRVRVGRMRTPFGSSMVVRRDEKEYRFDRVLDFWRQQARIDDLAWELHLRSGDGDAWLKMAADPSRVVCLGYPNPDGRLSYCLNTKLAQASLRVRPKGGGAFECRSPHGGALEFLRNESDARFERVV